MGLILHQLPNIDTSYAISTSHHVSFVMVASNASMGPNKVHSSQKKVHLNVYPNVRKTLDPKLSEFISMSK